MADHGYYVGVSSVGVKRRWSIAGLHDDENALSVAPMMFGQGRVPNGPACAPSLMTADKNLAAADTVGGADDALLFHLLDNPGGPIIANLEVTLDKAG